MTEPSWIVILTEYKNINIVEEKHFPVLGIQIVNMNVQDDTQYDNFKIAE